MRKRIQKISKYAPSIFQGRIDFARSSGRRTRGHGVSLSIEHPAERVVFRVLLFTLAMFAVLYVYFVGATILNVVARKEAITQTASLASAVSKLEREYFVATQDVGPEDGTRLGLAPVSQTDYVHRPGNAASAALPGNDI